MRRQAGKDIKQRPSKAVHAVVHGVDEEDKDDAWRVGHHSLARPMQVVPDPPFGHAEARLDRVKKQMTVSGNMSPEMDRGESRKNWRQVKNESDKYLDHNSKRESGNADT